MLARIQNSKTLVKEFTTDIFAAEYANFDKNVPASEPMINEIEIDWPQRVRQRSINAIQNPEIASDQAEEISDGDASNDENDELEQESKGFKEIITMLDKMKRSLSLITRAKICCLQSRKGLRTFNRRIESNLQLKHILTKACKYFWVNSFSKNTYTCTSTCNHFHNILRLFDVSPNFIFTTSNTMCDY